MRALVPMAEILSDSVSFACNSPRKLSCVGERPLGSHFACVRYANQQATRYHRSRCTIALLSFSSHQPRKAGRHAVSPQPRTLRMPFSTEYLAGYAFMLVQSLQQKYVPNRAVRRDGVGQARHWHWHWLKVWALLLVHTL